MFEPCLPLLCCSHHISRSSDSSIAELPTVLLPLCTFSITAVFITCTLSKHLPWLLGALGGTLLHLGLAASDRLLPSDSEASLLLVLQPCSPALPWLRNLFSICSHCCCSKPFTLQELILLYTLPGDPWKILPALLFLISKLMLQKVTSKALIPVVPLQGYVKAWFVVSHQPNQLLSACAHTNNRETGWDSLRRCSWVV